MRLTFMTSDPIDCWPYHIVLCNLTTFTGFHDLLTLASLAGLNLLNITLTDLMTCQPHGLLMSRLGYWFYDLLWTRPTDFMTYWQQDLLTTRPADFMTCWHHDLLTSWPANIMTCWLHDLMTSWPAELSWRDDSNLLNTEPADLKTYWFWPPDLMTL